MKPYKFIARYKRLEKGDPWKDFEKYLYLTPAEADLAQRDNAGFLLQQIGKGQLPAGYYEEVQLYKWKTKKRWKSKIKKKRK